MSDKPRIIYVFDALCGWCYGFSDAITRFAAQHGDDFEYTVISGGLWTGDRKVAVSSFDYIAGADAQISARTGAVFGAEYEKARVGSTVLDSEAAAAGFAVLRALAPDRVIELAAALQKAWYVDGKDIAQAETVATVGESFGLNGDDIRARLADPSAKLEAWEDFGQAADLGVHSFPTLVVDVRGELFALAQGSATLDEIEQRLASVLN